MKRFCTLLSIISLMVLLLQAETVRQEVAVHFRNDIDRIEPEYSGNYRQLMAIDSIFRAIDADSALTLRRVELTGWASPPASVKYNIDLSHRRADAIASWLVANCDVPADSIVSLYCGVNYPLLSRMVSERRYRYADDVIAIADDTPASPAADNRLPRLRKLHDGVAWHELSLDYFPDMRRTDVVIIYDHAEVAPQPPVEEEPDTIVPAPEMVDTVVYTQPLPERNLYLSVHTNMLYDLLAVPNLGAEIYLGRNFSVAGNWWYAWWDKDRRHRYWRTYGGYLAGRYWFGSQAQQKPLTGHHVGVYAQAMLYDFEWGGNGYLSGIPGKNIFHQPTWGGGIEYGFALPIGRRLNIDFTIGLGYLNSHYWKYMPQDDRYVWLSRHKRHWWGPTKAEISLVWLLGHGNVNREKGGEK